MSFHAPERASRSRRYVIDYTPAANIFSERESIDALSATTFTLFDMLSPLYASYCRYSARLLR